MRGSSSPTSSAAVPAAQADKLRKFLGAPVQGEFSDVPARDLLRLLQEKHPGVNVLWSNAIADAQVTVKFTEPVPVAAVLQFLEDQRGWKFVIRDYGIVAAQADQVPPGALLVGDYWKKTREAPAEKK